MFLGLGLGLTRGGGGSAISAVRNEDGTVTITSVSPAPTVVRNEDGSVTITAVFPSSDTADILYSIDEGAWVLVEDASIPYDIPGTSAGNEARVFAGPIVLPVLVPVLSNFVPVGADSFTTNDGNIFIVETA